MKKVFFASFMILGFVLLQSQYNGIPFSDHYSKPYTDCAAIFFNDTVLVDDFSPLGECKLDFLEKGVLTLASVKLTDQGVSAIKKLPFQVAIKNQESNTMFLFTTGVVESIDVREIMNHCKMGDSILILTVDQQYNLTHHEIKLKGGC